MNSNLRPGIFDDASLKMVSGMPADWRPEIRSLADFIGELTNTASYLAQACRALNATPMLRPHLPYAFAVIAKLRNFVMALVQACKEYGLGTKAFELVDCPRQWKEPFSATAGERPEFFPRSLVEVLRTHASALAVVGTNAEKASLSYDAAIGYQRTMVGEEEVGKQLAEHMMEENIPDRCYRLVKIVDQQEDRVFLQLAIHPTEQVISSRAVLAVTGGEFHGRSE